MARWHYAGSLPSAIISWSAATIFPPDMRGLIAEALSKDKHSIRVSGEASDGRVPVHPGAQAYFSGAPLPAAEPATDLGHDHEHAH
jgi:hypothetical protein